MANDGISFRGGGFPSLAVLFLSDGPLGGGHGPRASGIPPHDGGEDFKKDRDRPGTVYGVLEGLKALIPALPRFLLVQPSSWPLLRAGSSREILHRVTPCGRTTTETMYIDGAVYA